MVGTIRQLYRSKVKNQVVFDALFIKLLNLKVGRKEGKVLVVPSEYLCKVFMEHYDGLMDHHVEFALGGACRQYIGNYSVTMIVND